MTQTEREKELRNTDYLDDLERMDADLVSQACARYRNQPGTQWFPTVGQIREHIDAVIQSRPMARPESISARYAAQLEAEGWKPPTEAEKAKVTEIVRRLAAGISLRRPEGAA